MKIGTSVSLDGNLTCSLDATYDLGASGATRFRDAWFSRKVGVSSGTTLENTLLTMNATRTIYVPDQTNFTGSMFIGTGGTTLSFVSGADGKYNLMMGLGAGLLMTTGSYNVGMGSQALLTCSSGNNNIGIGTTALYSLTTGYSNVGIGSNAGTSITTGVGNTCIGSYTGGGLTTASYNTIIGANVSGLNSNLYGYVIIASGFGFQRIVIDNSGLTGIANPTPAAQLDVISSGATIYAFKAKSAAGSSVPAAEFDAPSGVAPIKFTNLTSASSWVTPLQPIGVDSSGRVFLHEPVLTVNSLGPTIAGINPIDVDQAYAFNWTGLHTYVMNSTAQDAIVIAPPNRTTDGATDSHFIHWKAKMRSSGVNYVGDWRALADAITNTGLSNWVLRAGYDNTSYQDVLTVTPESVVRLKNIGNTNITAGDLWYEGRFISRESNGYNAYMVLGVSGSPEGVVTAAVGRLCTDLSNGDLYRKTSGAGNTGWTLTS